MPRRASSPVQRKSSAAPGLQTSTAARYLRSRNKSQELISRDCGLCPAWGKSYGKYYMPGLSRSGRGDSSIQLAALSVTGWGGGRSLFLYCSKSRAWLVRFKSPLRAEREESGSLCVFAIDHCQNVMPRRSANRLKGSNFMFLHKEHLDLTLASLLASSSPSVPPSAGARSFSTRSVTPAKESREALPRGQQHSHTAGFGSDHEVFQSCWQLPASLQQQAALPPSHLPFAAASQPTASGHFHSC